MITGRGRAFCAGDDVSVQARLQDPADADELCVGYIYALVDFVAHLRQPMISAVKGFEDGGV